MNISNHQINNYMLRPKLLLLLLFIAIHTRTQCCVRFQNRICVACPSGTHLYRGSCLMDIENCILYKDGFDCSKCANGFEVNQNGQCTPIIQPIIQPQNSPNQFTDTVIDFQQLRGPVPQSMSRAIDYFMSKNTGVKNSKPIRGTIRNYRNGTILISLQFRDNNSLYKGVVNTNQQGTNLQQISFQVTTSTFSAIADNQRNLILTGQNLGNSQIKILGNNNLNYITVDIQADQIYPVISDFIGFAQPQFAKLQPIKVLRALDNQSIYYYKLTYVVADGSSWELSANFNNITIIANYQGKVQISNPTRPNTQTIIKIQPSRIMSDLYFIMVYDSINKQFNNKYSQSVIRSASKSEDTSNIRYIVNFQQSNFVWEISSLINKNTFVVSGIIQTRKQSISSGINLINPQSTLKNTSNSISSALSPSNLPSNVNQPNSNPNTSNSNPNPNPPNSNTNPPNSNPNTSNSNPNPNPPNSNTNPPNSNPNTSNSNPNPPNPNPPNPGGQTPPVSKTINLPQRILGTVSSMTQVQSSQFTSGDFVQIDQMIRQLNAQSLSNSSLIAAYFTPSSFSRSYFLYYLKGLQIFEARVSRDMVRKRNYVLGFNKVA